MKAGVTKEQLVNALEALVKMTHQGNMELDNLKLVGNTVEITYKNGYIKTAPIGGDSGIAILRDVLSRI